MLARMTRLLAGYLSRQLALWADFLLWTLDLQPLPDTCAELLSARVILQHCFPMNVGKNVLALPDDLEVP